MSHRKESRHRAHIAGPLAAAFLLGSSGTQALCFKPLPDRNSHDPTHWKDLTALDPTGADHPVQKAPGVKNFLPIRVGVGETINLDYYEMTFSASPNLSLADFFQVLRMSFSTFSKDQSNDFDFHVYRTSTDANDVAALRNQALWKQSMPMGALMSFQLKDITFARGSKVSFNIKYVNGDVQATCASSTDFIFSTVETEVGSKHPVSGNRGFGLRTNTDGTWTFYSMGADRESDSLPNRLKISQRVDHKDIFQEGEGFWDSFYGQLTKSLGALSLAPHPLFRNSCRYKIDANNVISGASPECSPALP